MIGIGSGVNRIKTYQPGEHQNRMATHVIDTIYQMAGAQESVDAMQAFAAQMCDAVAEEASLDTANMPVLLQEVIVVCLMRQKQGREILPQEVTATLEQIGRWTVELEPYLKQDASTLLAHGISNYNKRMNDTGYVIDNIYVKTDSFQSVEHRDFFWARLQDFSFSEGLRLSTTCRSLYLNYHSSNAWTRRLKSDYDNPSNLSARDIFKNDPKSRLDHYIFLGENGTRYLLTERLGFFAKEKINLTRFPSVLHQLEKGELRIEAMAELLKEIDQVVSGLNKSVYIVTARLCSEIGKLELLEYHVSGALRIEQISQLTNYQIIALEKNTPAFKKYFGGHAGVKTLHEEAIDFDFEVMNDSWVQKRIDDTSLTFKQLTQLSRASRKGSGISEDIFLQKSVQWSIDNLNNPNELIEDIFNGLDVKIMVQNSKYLLEREQTIRWGIDTAGLKVNYVLSSTRDKWDAWFHDVFALYKESQEIEKSQAQVKYLS